MYTHMSKVTVGDCTTVDFASLGVTIADIVAYYEKENARKWEYAIQLSDTECLIVLGSPANSFIRLTFPSSAGSNDSCGLSLWLSSQVPDQGWVATLAHELEYQSRPADCIQEIYFKEMFTPSEQKELIELIPSVSGGGKDPKERAIDIFLYKTHLLASRLRARREAEAISVRAPGFFAHYFLRNQDAVRLEAVWHGYEVGFILQQSGEVFLTVGGQVIPEGVENGDDITKLSWHGTFAPSASGNSLIHPLWRGHIPYQNETMRSLFGKYGEETCLQITGEELAELFSRTVDVLEVAPYQYAFFPEDTVLDEEIEEELDAHKRSLLALQRRKRLRRVDAHEFEEALAKVHEENPDLNFSEPIAYDRRVFPRETPEFIVLP